MRVIAALTLAVAVPAAAQSSDALEAVRLHRPQALERVKSELASCARQRGTDAGATSPDLSCQRLSLLAGYLMLSEGDARSACAQLASTPAPPQLGAIHAYYLGEAHFYSQQPAEAARQFETVLDGSPPGWLATKLRARLGEALLAAGEVVQAAPLLEKAALRAATPELYWQRAIARRDTGNVDGHRADLRTLAIRFPGHPYGEAALAQLRAQPGKAWVMTFDDRLMRAAGLTDAGRARDGLAELDAVVKEKLARGASAKARLAFARASVLFALGDEAGGDAQLGAVLSAKGQASIAAEALMLRARRIMRSDDNQKARDAMAEVSRRYPREPPADDAAYFAGWLDLQAKRFEAAVKTFEDFEKRHPKSRKLDEALWLRSLALIKLQKHRDARDVLDRLVKSVPRSSLVPQAKYWSIRSMQLAGEDPIAEYQSLIAVFPGSLYALLAGERLRELSIPPPHPFPDPPRRLEVKVPPELALALALAESGLFKDADEEVQSRMASIRGPEAALRFGHALQSLGQFGQAYALAARLLWGAAYGSRQPEALALLYPRAYEGTVMREATAQGLDPFLVWAIMRRESAFRPEVASAANARGLMQIIPPTAVAIAKRTTAPAPQPEELFSPELSIRLGAWYLKALLDRFEHPALCAAAYNAGPTAVARWQKEKGSLPLDLFIEEIPYKETRLYVKQVVADYFIYRGLYGGQPDPKQRLSMSLSAPKAGGVDF